MPVIHNLPQLLILGIGHAVKNQETKTEMYLLASTNMSNSHHSTSLETVQMLSRSKKRHTYGRKIEVILGVQPGLFKGYFSKFSKSFLSTDTDSLLGKTLSYPQIAYIFWYLIIFQFICALWVSHSERYRCMKIIHPADHTAQLLH